MTFEQLMDKLTGAKLTLGHLIQLRKRGLFSKLSKMEVDIDPLAEMTDEEFLEHIKDMTDEEKEATKKAKILAEEKSMDDTMDMVELMANMIHVLARPEDMTVEDITYIIEMDQIEELTLALNDAFEKLGKMGKN